MFRCIDQFSPPSVSVMIGNRDCHLPFQKIHLASPLRHPIAEAEDWSSDFTIEILPVDSIEYLLYPFCLRIRHDD